MDRHGFQKLVAEVGMGHAGIVLGLEVSRLARNSTDWHRLLEICALTDTLILDEDGIYDPAHFNDRLLLGLKGTMSEAELHVLHARLRGGIINKARRGQLHFRLPVGFVYVGDGRVVLDPDQQVQESVRLLFDTFDRTGAAHATVKYFRQQRLLYPTRLAAGPRNGEVAWAPLCLGRVASTLHNPWYAGVYAYGRCRSRKLPDGHVRKEQLPPGEWLALIRDAHPAYISWEEYERTQQRLQASAKAVAVKLRQTSPREGPALLQGHAVCGLCGSRMHIHYNKRRGGQIIPHYVCVGRRRLFGDPMCQSIVGAEIDAAVGKMLVEAVTPMALEVAIAVQQEIQSRVDEADRLRHRQVERAQYEADHARHRYMQVDPANRLVADSLEADWNARLRDLAQAQEEYQRQRVSDRLTIDDGERQRILALATDFPAVWSDSNTPHRERKRMLALLVEDVTLIKQRQITAAIRFRGGATTTLTLPRPLTAHQLRATHEDVRREIDAMLDEYTDAQVANRLNERGLRTGAGDAFDPVSVQWVRCSHKIKSLKERLLAAGWLTSKQIRAILGVNRSTLAAWRIEGRLKGRICNDLGEWLYWPPAQPTPVVEAPDAHVEVNLAPGRDDIGEDVHRQMNALLDEHTDAEVANILNQRGLRTGAGQPFDPITVRWIRSSTNLKSLEERLLAAGWLTTNQIVARLRINRSTVATWRSNRRLNGRICNDRGGWLYQPPEEIPSDVNAPAAHVPSGGASSNDDNSNARGAV